MKYSTTVCQAISEATDNFAYHVVGRKLTTLYLITGKIPDTIYLTENSKHIVRIEVIANIKFTICFIFKPHWKHSTSSC